MSAECMLSSKGLRAAATSVRLLAGMDAFMTSQGRQSLEEFTAAVERATVEPFTAVCPFVYSQGIRLGECLGRDVAHVRLNAGMSPCMDHMFAQRAKLL